MDLKEIELELSEILQTDKNNWVRFYQLLDIVDKNKLYISEYGTFTKYVNSLADKYKINVSLIWKRKKAGKFYSDFERYQKQQGVDVTPLSELKIDSENLNFIEKISGGDMNIADELIKKTQNGSLSRKDLREVWQTKKAEHCKLGLPKTRKTRHDSNIYSPQSQSQSQSEFNGAMSSITSVTSADIVLALRSSEWIDCNLIQNREHRKYRLFTEFPVYTGDTRHARRIDALIIENITIDKHIYDEVALHGIEIKVSKSDLMNDNKMSEYMFFCDYFYIAVPNELKECAKLYINEQAHPEQFGLLLFDKKNEIHIEIYPQMHIGTLREKTLTTAALKMM